MRETVGEGPATARGPTDQWGLDMRACSRRTSARIRRLGPLAVAVLVTALLPTSALAQTATARNIDSGCPTGVIPDAGFVDGAGTFAREIDCIVAYGIAAGTSTSTYSPGDEVTRGQMATFLANVMLATDHVRPSGLADYFTDDDGLSHERNINWLAAYGIVSGFGDGTYRPGDHVTRAQMATFLNNLLGVITGQRLTSGSDFFADDDGNAHEANINGLAAYGIVSGTSSSTYGPGGFVTRGQMAGFLAREADFLVDDGDLQVYEPPASEPVQVFTVTPTSAVTLPTSDNASTATSDLGRRTYTATLPADVSQVNIALLPAEQVVTASDGTVRFSSTTPVLENSGVSIEKLGSSTLDAADHTDDRTQLTGVTVVNRSVSFTVDAIVADSVVPVVYEDSVNPATDRLDLDGTASASSPKVPLERFGVGGRVTWGSDEPAVGTDVPVGTVRQASPASGFYTLDTTGDGVADYTLRLYAGDTFRYTAANGGPGTISSTQFGTWLSVGDRVDPGVYDPGNTWHTIVGDIPLTPSSVNASTSSGTVTLTVGKPSSPVASISSSTYRLQRALVSGGTIGSYTEIASVAANLSTISFTDTPGTGTWAYRVLVRSLTGDSPTTSPVQVSVVAPSSTAPASTSASYSDTDASGSTGPNGVLDNGDSLTFTFDRAVTLGSSWSLQLLDRDGTVGTIDNTNATYFITGDQRMVSFVVGAAGPSIGTSGGDGGLGGAGQLDIQPAASTTDSGFLQVMQVTGIGNNIGWWNLAKSGLTATYGNSRVVIDGTGAGARTPAAPGTPTVTSAASNRIEYGRDEVQQLSALVADGGTFTLTYTPPAGSSVTTAAIPYNATASAIYQALLNVGMPMIVTADGATGVSGGPINSSAIAFTFGGSNLGGVDVAPLTVDASQLTRTGGSVVAPAISTLTQGAQATGIGAWDGVRVYTLDGSYLGGDVAESAGRAVINLTQDVTPGQQVLVVVQQLGSTQRYSHTATVTMS